MIKDYMIPVYALLVKGKKYDIEPKPKSKNVVVPEEYRIHVAKHLADNDK